MSIFETEVLKVTAGGAVSVVDLEIHDDDFKMQSEEVGAEWIVDGVSLGPDAPVLNIGRLERTEYNGQTWELGTIHFSDGANDYYMSLVGQDPNHIESFVSFTSTGTAGSIQYAFYGATPKDSDTYSGDALMLRYDSGGVLQSFEANVFRALDDDGTIEFASETGEQPIGLGADSLFRLDIYETDAGAGDTLMVKVRVEYTTASGNGTMDAIKVTEKHGPSTYVFYVPENGHVDLSTITGFVSETVLAGSLEGDSWADYGLTTDLITVNGTSGNDSLEGGHDHDKLKGNAGDDFLFGYVGDDELRGGAGDDVLFGGQGEDDMEGGSDADVLYGGMHKDHLKGGKNGDELFGGAGGDTLEGGTGLDTLEGGRGYDSLLGGDHADSLKGDDGYDTLKGGKGNDTLKGGKGNDELLGGNGADRLEGGKGLDDLSGGGGNDELLGQKGKDTLNGGAGADTLTGGEAADTFVFTADGATDTITDFEDGTDLIDLDVGFGSLTIADVAPGEVHITHSGETLIVMDSGGTLTAADFSAADFI
ncbi:hypothetical protein NNA36_02150 [Shimia sp. CNT1-13L.2]|uniref:calcium-binding protein n=1 Tax=Shimia sp. CNT1-13L.2 TaxID=2959663 RepID=UPI0020CCB3F8|nr:calcium-binding protein [Shimia sp. CNT1-13L.2]MCP9480757.1 hypothetical protein [Shimia sp. CNT1-13L.2]